MHGILNRAILIKITQELYRSPCRDYDGEKHTQSAQAPAECLTALPVECDARVGLMMAQPSFHSAFRIEGVQRIAALPQGAFPSYCMLKGLVSSRQQMETLNTDPARE
ncbi:unnamed protein product [Periconia digitata]|uniref:Uncharacterized protein n=1 Tax=Periconia digitata TaxID=1303443 RepID=A0A9W4UGA6_9PLEO|nr:unnamed protein product [Periconia digitata]